MSDRGLERLPRVPRRRVLDAAAEALGVGRLTFIAELGGGGRTHVWRVSDGTTSYVVKAYRSGEGNTWAREAAALRGLADAGVGPRLLARGDEPRMVVLADLGDHPGVAELLLGRDAAAASAALGRWVDAMADLHLAGDADAQDAYRRALHGWAPDQPVHAMPGELRDAVDNLSRLGRDLGVELRDAADLLLATPHEFEHDRRVLTPSDMCPDNVALLADRAVLLDFEWAEVRHLAWDVAYLRVPWATCWCAWELPADVAEEGLARYRRRLAPSVPYVATDAFLRDLNRATLAWCLLTTSMFLHAALGRQGRGSARRPGRRALILNRLALAQSLPGHDPLASYAARLSAELVSRWGEHPLDLAPAWR